MIVDQKRLGEIAIMLDQAELVRTGYMRTEEIHQLLASAADSVSSAEASVLKAHVLLTRKLTEWRASEVTVPSVDELRAYVNYLSTLS